MRKNITLNKGNGKQNPLPFYIKAVEKIIKWGRVEGSLKMWGKKIKIKEMGMKKNFLLKGTKQFYSFHPYFLTLY